MVFQALVQGSVTAWRNGPQTVVYTRNLTQITNV